MLARYLRGVHDDAAALAHPERLERRTRGMARMGALITPALLERSMAGEQALDREGLGPAAGPRRAASRPPPRRGRRRSGSSTGSGALWTLNAVAGMVPFTGIWNVTGRPAASVPAGMGFDGLPRAVQLVGRPGEEATLLSLSAQIESERPWAGERPPGFWWASEPEEFLQVAIDAARMAGALLTDRVRTGSEHEVSSKSTPTDLVSEADRASERAIRDLLHTRRPEDGFVGEEGGSERGTSGLEWVVDPLDGTVNFLFGIPQWCVSVAVRDDAGTLAGAIWDPAREELFTATRAGPASAAREGATRELAGGRTPAAHSSGADDGLAGAMVATGLAYDARVREAQAAVLARLIPAFVTSGASGAPHWTSHGPPPAL